MIIAVRTQLAALALLAACSPSPRTVTLPKLPHFVPAEILGIRRGAEVRAFVHDPLSATAFQLPITFDAGEEVELEAHLFTRELDELEISEGELPRASAGELLSVPLPATHLIYAARVTTDGASEWTQSTTRVLEGFRIRTSWIAPIDCIKHGGCYDAATAQECRLPCAASTTVEPPEPPEPAPPPTLTPCPSGWTAGPPGELETCEPWSANERPPCPNGQARFPGDEACADLSPCPSGEWPDPSAFPPDRTILHVRAGSTSPGDGSATAPYGTLSEAYTSPSFDGAIALSKGEHPITTLVLDRPVTIAGACAADTIIRSTTGALFTVEAQEVTLAGARLLGDTDALEVNGGTLSLEAIDIAAGTRGLIVRTGSVSAQRLRVRDLRGPALRIEGGGTLTATAVEISRATGTAIAVTGDRSSANLSDVAISDTTPDEVGYGRGVHVSTRGRARLSRAAIERSSGAAVHAEGGLEGGRISRLELSRSLIRDVVPLADGTYGEGARILNRASASFDRVSIDRTHFAGLHAAFAAKVVTRDLAIRDVSPTANDGSAGFGALLRSPSTNLDAERLWIQRAHTAGASFSESSATITGLTVLDVRSRASDGVFGQGVLLSNGATVNISHARIENVREYGVDVDTDASTLTLRHATIARISTSTSSRGGCGALVRQGSWLELRRARIERAASCGIQLDGGMSNAPDIALEDVDIDFAGKGLVIGAPGVIARRIEITNSRTYGVQLDGTNAAATFYDLAVTGTQCAPAGCVTDLDGTGVAVSGGANVALDGFKLLGQRNNGLVLRGGLSHAALYDGEILATPVGLIVAAPIDLRFLAIFVLHLGNEVNIVERAEQ